MYGEPLLLAREPEPWPDDLLGRVLAVPEAQPLLDGAALGYLVEFVALNRRQFGESAQHALAATLRRVFAEASDRVLKDHKDRLVRLVDEIPSDRCRRLSFGGNWPAKTRQAVCGVESDLLIVPDVLETSAGEGVFDPPHAVKVLKLLEKDMLAGRNTNPANEVIGASANPAVVCNDTAELKLWKVQCPDAGGKSATDEVRSLSDLRAALNAQSLFVGPLNDELRELAATVTTRLTVLNDDVARTLFAQTPPPRGDAAGQIAHLDSMPALQGQEARRPLVLRLMTATGDESFRTRRRWAVRFLLHADKELPSKDDLYLPADSAEVIGKVARAVLERQGSAGRLLQTSPLTVSLNDQQRGELGLVKLDWDGLARLLGGQQTTPDVSFDDAEQDQLLDGLRNHKHAIRLLPLHDRAYGGGRVPLTDGCYWQTNEKVDLGTLAAVVTLLKPHPKKSLATTQTEAGGIELTVLAVADLAIKHDPPTHWQTLLTAMASAGILKDDRADPLKKLPWLPLAGGGLVAPNQVLHDEQLNGEIAAVVRRLTPADGDPVPQGKLDETVRKHDGFKALARLLPDRARTLLLLGGLLGRDPQFHVGRIAELSVWCEAFRDAPPDVMAAAPLLTRMHQVAMEECRKHAANPSARVTDDEVEAALKDCRSHFLPSLYKTPPVERLEKILAFLRGRFGQTNGDERRTVVQVHNAYLRQFAAQADEARGVLPRLKLLNQNGEWVETAKLCIAAGIDRADSLDATQAGILG